MANSEILNLMKNANNSLSVKGIFEQEKDLPNPKSIPIGSVVYNIDEKQMLVATDNSWANISIDTTDAYYEKKHDKLIDKLICFSCGAPLDLTEKDLANGYCKCKYCDTNISIYK